MTFDEHKLRHHIPARNCAIHVSENTLTSKPTINCCTKSEAAANVFQINEHVLDGKYAETRTQTQQLYDSVVTGQ